MFTHLHVHSHYSLLDGLPKIEDLVRAAKTKNFNALALTDHGVMFGAVEFYKACKAEGIKPIIGLEAYLSAGPMEEKSSGIGEKPYHLTLLAENFEGYKNLMRLTSIAHLKGFYYKPRVDFNTLLAHKTGLTILSGCPASEASRAALAGNIEKTREIIKKYQQSFGDRYYIEIQRQPMEDYNEFAPKRDAMNKILIQLAHELNVPLVATADSHYLEPQDAEAHDVLVCIGTGRIVADSNRLDMRGTDLSLKTEAQMKVLFSDLPDAIWNTAKIAERVNIEIPLGSYHFPHFEIPDGTTHDEQLRKLAISGLAQAYKCQASELTHKYPDVYQRLLYELDVIIQKEYPSYFLIVADFSNWARAHGVIATTRGSAAGSLVAYSLGITTINPLDYNLPFERFLNPERPSAPDIDMDFADSRRDEVIKYVSDKYGEDKVAQIVTFGTMMARAAVRDVGRALGIAYGKCDRIAKMIPFGRQGFHMTIKQAIKISPDLKRAYQEDFETKKIVDLAQKVEGAARHPSIHAAGVVISPSTLTDYTPIRSDTESGTITTQYDMHACEDVGLVKMDFLGIRNLSILGNAVKIVEKTRGIKIDLESLPLDDEKTFKLLTEGRTVGLFQLGGSGMTRYLKELKPSKIEDIMAMIALYRPGPMESIPEFIKRKHNPSLITYLDPALEDILKTSYGILTYQDDVLVIAIKIAGYSWLEADKLRKAMGKKIPKEMAAQKEKFISGCMENGWGTEKSIKLWMLIEPFAAYGFGKAHAASYSIVAYQTSYMKANFPVEYMAAVLTAESHNLDNVAEAVAECGSLGIHVLPPDVNESLAGFTVVSNDTIRFGLSAVKNLGSDVIDKIIEERKKNGKFLSLSDFVSKAFTRTFNKKSWEALVKCGALDSFGERNQLLTNADKVLGLARAFAKELQDTQTTLFGTPSSSELKIVLENSEPATDKQRLLWEKELLGLYVTSHPLEEFRPIMDKLDNPISRMKSDHRERRVEFLAVLNKVKTILTKKGEQMCFAEAEDQTGSVELVVFPKVFTESRLLLDQSGPVKIMGSFTLKEGEPKILADKIVGFSPETTSSEEKGKEGQTFEVNIPDGISPMVFQKLKKVFESYPGTIKVELRFNSPHGQSKSVPTEFLVEPSLEFRRSIATVLGE